VVLRKERNFNGRWAVLKAARWLLLIRALTPVAVFWVAAGIAEQGRQIPLRVLKSPVVLPKRASFKTKSGVVDPARQAEKGR